MDKWIIANNIKRHEPVKMNEDNCVKDTFILLIATSNQGKFQEIAHELRDLPIKCLSLKDFPPVPECEETGNTFYENALQKARYYAQQFNVYALADDSGLEVDALGGKPGVYSARYAGEPCNDNANNAKLIKELADVPQEKRTARFKCAMALVDNKGNVLASSEGIIEGFIIDTAKGTNGFGYDPHFFVPELGKTTAEISREEKNKISHRGKATRAIKSQIAKLLSKNK